MNELLEPIVTSRYNREDFFYEYGIENIQIDLKTNTTTINLGIDKVSKDMMILVGPAASGKTLLLTVSFLIFKIMNKHKELLIHGGDDVEQKLFKYSARLCDTVIKSYSNWNGSIRIKDNNDCIYNYTLWFKDNKLTYISPVIKDPHAFTINTIRPVTFIQQSKLYSNYITYLEYIKNNPIPNGLTLEELIELPGNDEYIAKIGTLFAMNDLLIFDSLIMFFLWLENVPGSRKNDLINFAESLSPYIYDSTKTTHENIHAAFNFGDHPQNNVLAYRKGKLYIKYMKGDSVNYKDVAELSNGEQSVLMQTIIIKSVDIQGNFFKKLPPVQFQELLKILKKLRKIHGY